MPEFREEFDAKIPFALIANQFVSCNGEKFDFSLIRIRDISLKPNEAHLEIGLEAVPAIGVFQTLDDSSVSFAQEPFSVFVEDLAVGCLDSIIHGIGNHRRDIEGATDGDIGCVFGS